MHAPDSSSLTHRIIGLAMRVHTRLGPGLLESAYEHACATNRPERAPLCATGRSAAGIRRRPARLLLPRRSYHQQRGDLGIEMRRAHPAIARSSTSHLPAPQPVPHRAVAELQRPFVEGRIPPPVSLARLSRVGRLHLRPAVAQPDRAVEHQMPRRAVRIGAEITLPLELHRLTHPTAGASAGSTRHPRSTSSELGLRSAITSPSAPGSGRANNVLYSRTSAGSASAAATQCSVACTRRPSGASPPRVAGS